MALTCIAGLSLAVHAQQQQQPQPPSSSSPTAAATPPAPIPMTEALVIGPVGHSGREPLHSDVIEHLIVTGQWRTPHEGESVTLPPDGKKKSTWKLVKAGKDGAISDNTLQGGYALWSIDSDLPDHPMLLSAVNDSMVYVNGVPRGGDPYGFGWLSIPVEVRQGHNEFLFLCGRGQVKATLNPLPGDGNMIQFTQADALLPDILRGDSESKGYVAGIVVINATDKPLVNFQVTSWIGSDSIGAVITDESKAAATYPVEEIAPMTIRKIPVFLANPKLGGSDAPTKDEFVTYTIQLHRDRDLLAKTEIKCRVRTLRELHNLTFVSDIDNSVQYYAVQPQAKSSDDSATAGADHSPSLYLTLHGAGVEGTGQAACYPNYPQGPVVAPTNRRAFGFDWEDWGRMDAMEVLRLAEARFHPDPTRLYLTGHSMGGHGTWQIGSVLTPRFAAIAPSAGWISFWSYVGTPEGKIKDPIQRVVDRAQNISRTLDMIDNLKQVGVYILHGQKDDNVPVEQAREMRGRLGKFHTDFAYYERPGAGHWWGNQCVNWPPLIAFLNFHQRKPVKDVDHVEFVTVNPGVSAISDWATINSQYRSLDPSKIDLSITDRAKHLISGTTMNVASLTLDLSIFDDEAAIASDKDKSNSLNVQIRLDDAKDPVTVPFNITQKTFGTVTMTRTAQGAAWQAANPMFETGRLAKSPTLAGPFKEAFRNHAVFVYGTIGHPDENAWAFNKARYDAETFYYRGNGAFTVMSDKDYLASPADQKNRDVILYGNEDTNAAWNFVFHGAPFHVGRASLSMGGHMILRDDVGALLVYPQVRNGGYAVPGDKDASTTTTLAAAVTGTGLNGFRLMTRMPYFVSGIHYPDVFIATPDILQSGYKGVLGAGFFGPDWSVEKGDFQWRE